MSIILVTGGSRSGKSKFAEKLAEENSKNLCYVATAQIFDQEMQNRVKLHQERRGSDWNTIEIPYNILDFLEKFKSYDVVLLDCLTMLVSNKMFSYKIDYNSEDLEKINIIEKEIIFFIENILLELKSLKTKFIIVTNEVGLGIIPENRLSRVYRDIVGRSNQIAAEYSDEVFMVLSGIPIRIKG